MLNTLKRIVESSWLNLTVGLVLFSTGAYEVADVVESGLERPRIGAHHGAMAFGLLHSLKSLVAIFEGFEHIHKR